MSHQAFMVSLGWTFTSEKETIQSTCFSLNTRSLFPPKESALAAIRAQHVSINSRFPPPVGNKKPKKQQAPWRSQVSPHQGVHAGEIGEIKPANKDVEMEISSMPTVSALKPGKAEVTTRR